MDGYALMRQIRQLPLIKAGKFQRSRSLLMPEKLTSNRHSAAGFQQHVAKPVDPETLVSAISALCNNSPPDSIL